MGYFIKNSIECSAKNMLYWIERALEDLENKESAFTALKFALGYAHDLDVFMARFEEKIESIIDWKEIIEKAREDAKKELETDHKLQGE